MVESRSDSVRLAARGGGTDLTDHLLNRDQLNDITGERPTEQADGGDSAVRASKALPAESSHQPRPESAGHEFPAATQRSIAFHSLS